VINCASTYTAVLLRRHRKNRALGPASLEGGRTCRWARWLERSPRDRFCVGFRRGRQRPLISAKSNHRPMVSRKVRQRRLSAHRGASCSSRRGAVLVDDQFDRASRLQVRDLLVPTKRRGQDTLQRKELDLRLALYAYLSNRRR